MATPSRPSTYHRDRGCAHNQEPDPTCFHLSKQEQPFHVDLLFTPVEWGLEGVQHRSYKAVVLVAKPVIVDQVPDSACIVAGQGRWLTPTRWFRGACW